VKIAAFRRAYPEHALVVINKVALSALERAAARYAA
jgi:hypothetical protein